jgi:hypothetical protein
MRILAIQRKSIWTLLCTPPSCEAFPKTAFGRFSCIWDRKVSNAHLEQGTLHGTGWSSCECLSTMFWMPQGHKQCSEYSFQSNWATWIVLNQKERPHSEGNSKSVYCHFLLILWIGRYGDQIGQNEHHRWNQTVKIHRIMLYLKHFGQVLARWCFELWWAYGLKTCSWTHMLGSSIQPKPNQITWGKV